MDSSTLRRLAGLLPAGALALSLTACGGSSTDTTTGSTAVATPNAATSTTSSAATTGVTATAVTTTASTTTSATTSSAAASTATASTTQASASTDALSIRVSGNRFVDGSGHTLQLRGVNISALEFTSMEGLDDGNPWAWQTGDATPNWNTIKSWGTNAVRIPLNEASWLALTCTDTSNNVLHADPGNNYKSTVIQAVHDATAAGLYVILDLHWTAPGTTCPLLQTQMADADHSLTFWTDVATQFKNHGNVLFELFNEPFFNFDFSGNLWSYMMFGTNGAFSGYPASGRAWVWQNVSSNWGIASMQAMLNAVRATGATNVVLIGSDGYTQDLSGWVANHPTDPLGQMGATWHAYPMWGAALGSADDALPNFGTQAYTWAGNILAAGFPVVITEFGGHNSPSTVGAPMAQRLLQWSDQQGASYFGWTWNDWGTNENLLIKDAAGTPTDGFGVYVKSHYLCAATGSTNCP